MRYPERKMGLHHHCAETLPSRTSAPCPRIRAARPGPSVPAAHHPLVTAPAGGLEGSPPLPAPPPRALGARPLSRADRSPSLSRRRNRFRIAQASIRRLLFRLRVPVPPPHTGEAARPWGLRGSSMPARPLRTVTRRGGGAPGADDPPQNPTRCVRPIDVPPGGTSRGEYASRNAPPLPVLRTPVSGCSLSRGCCG